MGFSRISSLRARVCAGVLLAAVSATGLTACGKEPGGDGSISQGDRPAPTPEPIQPGTLVKRLLALEGSESYDRCDREWRERKIELLKALDQRALSAPKGAPDTDRPADMRSGSPASDSYGLLQDPTEVIQYRWVTLPFGPIRLKDIEPRPPVTPGWKVEEKSWGGYYEEFKQLLNLPLNEENRARWKNLETAVQFLIFDDEGRLKFLRNMTLNHESQTVMNAAVNKIFQCLQSLRCTDPGLTADETLFVRRHPPHAARLEKLEKITDFVARRWALVELHRTLKQEFEQTFGFRKYAHMRQSAPGTFQVAVDPGDFEGHQVDLGFEQPVSVLALFQMIIDQYWKAPAGMSKRRIEIQWVRAPRNSGVYRLEAGDVQDGRSYVSWTSDGSDNKMVLQPGAFVSAVAHEMGHILGFSDEYYTTWDPETCVYREHSTQESLMSEHLPGPLKEWHWKRLDEVYPFNAPVESEAPKPAETLTIEVRF